MAEAQVPTLPAVVCGRMLPPGCVHPPPGRVLVAPRVNTGEPGVPVIVCILYVAPELLRWATRYSVASVEE